MTKFSVGRLDTGDRIFGDFDKHNSAISTFIRAALNDEAVVVFWLGKVRSEIFFDEDGDLHIKTRPEVLKVLSDFI